MPAFTAITLDRFLEPGSSKSNPASHSLLNSRASKSIPGRELENGNIVSSTNKKFSSVPMSPEVYSCSESIPFADTPSSFPLSSYIVKRNRRDPSILKTVSPGNAPSESINLIPGEENLCECKRTEANKVQNLENGGLVFPETRNGVRNIEGNPDRDNGSIYFDPQESLSYAGSTDGEDNCNGECSQNTPMGEFYDAWEELSSGSGCRSSPRDIDAELREMRLCLLAEIEKRKQAEGTLKRMQSHWQETKQYLSAAGLILPEFGGGDDQLSKNTAQDLCQQVLFTWHVSESVGEEVGKSEVEMDMGFRIERKNFEIARLCDRMRTCEAINREMCRRNQEAIERTRQKRKLVRMRRRQWKWGLVGASVVVGVGLLASAYLPISEPTQSSKAQ